jgi:hypothetical protein
MKGWIGRSAVTVIVLTFLQGLVGAFLLRDAPPVPQALSWALASNALVALLITYLALRCGGSGLGRAGLLFVVLFGIPADYLAEAFFFDIGLSRPMLLRLYLDNLLVAAAVAAFVAWSVRNAPAPAAADPSRPPRASALRLAIAALSYVVAYFTAGLAAYPYLADFYAGRVMPSVGQVALIQVFRGLAYAGIGFAIVRGLAASRLEKSLAVGLTLSIVGGVAPLMVPNAYLPTPVRLVHLVEVGVSNFLFGAFVGWLLAARSSTPGTEHVEAAAA